MSLQPIYKNISVVKDQVIKESPTSNIQHPTSNIQRSHTLPVMELFYTLQGEGFHQGKAAYFIRLGGCDVGCFWCDVKESWDVTAHPLRPVDEIVEQAKASGCHL